MTNYTAATVNDLVNALLGAQSPSSSTIKLTKPFYDLSTSTVTRDSRFGTGTLVSSLPTIKKNVTITVDIDQVNYPGVHRATITRSGTKYRHFYVAQGGTLTISNVDLLNGDVGTLDSGGGAIFSDGTLKVNHCKFSGNKSNYGGAIINNRGTTTIKNCDFDSNQADWGGALYNYLTSNSCVMTVDDSRFIYNQANETWQIGGGVANFGTLALTHCMLNNNSANNGGGIANWDASAHLTIKRSHLVDNIAYSYGGGIHNNVGTTTVQESSLIGNTAGTDSGRQVYKATGSVTLTKIALNDFYDPAGDLTGVSVTTPLPEWQPNFTMVTDTSGNLMPSYNYSRNFVAYRATQLANANFQYFPQNYPQVPRNPNDPQNPGVRGYIDIGYDYKDPNGPPPATRLRRDYLNTLTHQTGVSTGSSIFVSEMLHYAGLPMTVEPGDNNTNPTLCSDGAQGSGYTKSGWHYCPSQLSATVSWKSHPDIISYFTSLGGNFAGSVTLDEIIGIIYTTEQAQGPNTSGTLKSDPNKRDAMIARFASSGDLGSIAVGDYVYVVTHGFMIVGWGPFLGTIDGISFAVNNSTLSDIRSDANPIPYVADFCYGTDQNPTNGDGTGWLQDPRPRPFYAAATRVFDSNLRPDEVNYLKRRTVPVYYPQPVPVYDNETADVYQFFKIPDRITVSSTFLSSRLYFSG